MLVLTPKKELRTVRALGLFGTALPFGIAIVLACTYARKNLSLFDEKMKWIKFGDFTAVDKRWFSIYYELGIDGLSLVMMVLTALSKQSILYAECSASFAQNLMLIFFEITLPPMFLLIESVVNSYLIYNGIGSAILLIVFSILFAKTGTTNIVELKEILRSVNAEGALVIPSSLRLSVFIAIMIAFAIKLPVFPLHRWMVNVHIEAHPAVVMLHAGVLLKIERTVLFASGKGYSRNIFTMLQH